MPNNRIISIDCQNVPYLQLHYYTLLFLLIIYISILEQLKKKNLQLLSLASKPSTIALPSLPFNNFFFFCKIDEPYIILLDNNFFLQVKEEAQQLALIFETVGAFKVKRKGGKGKQIFGR